MNHTDLILSADRDHVAGGRLTAAAVLAWLDGPGPVLPF